MNRSRIFVGVIICENNGNSFFAMASIVRGAASRTMNDATQRSNVYVIEFYFGYSSDVAKIATDFRNLEVFVEKRQTRQMTWMVLIFSFIWLRSALFR